MRLSREDLRWMEKKVVTNSELDNERDEQIAQLQEMMMVVNDFFQRISILIEEQDPDIIRITEHIRDSEKEIESGVRELTKVSKKR